MKTEDGSQKSEAVPKNFRLPTPDFQLQNKER